MNEPLLERIRVLERSVKRWRLTSLALALLLVCALAIAGIFMAIPPRQEPGDFWLFLPWVRARHQAEQAELARREEALQALRAAEAMRQHLEAKQREKQPAPTAEAVNKQQP